MYKIVIHSWEGVMNSTDLLCITVKISNISHNLVGNKIVDRSDVVGASPVGAASANYIFILDLTFGFKELGKDSTSVGIGCALY